ncbi:hypothetical protein DH2020_047504 [Rehmannia glutinosa]|uniref:Polygalacturonase n=1 Tax=Rehmannia glutinosa TaxID=99300 RepID=A0ABR0U8L8_REHGL
MEVAKVLVAVLFAVPFLAYAQEPVLYDIRKYGAAPGGADISQALLSAWKDATAANTSSKVFIPPGTWTLSQAVLVGGTNKSPIELEVQGTLEAYSDSRRMPNPDGQWITINYVNYFTLYGGGVLDGKGQDAWKANDCNTNKNCAKLPINLSLNFINNTIIHDITVKDSKNFQVNCISSHNVTFHNFHISAPDESINTDGIHIARSTSIKVIDSIIETGDDCISIGDESQDYHIQNVTCGPGHGISIGSLGKGAEEKDVTGITVIDCKFKQTQNGVKSEDMAISAPATLKDPSKIQFSNVNIKNIKGTSNTKEVVILACQSHPCKDVTIADIDVSYVGSVATNVTNICSNVQPTFVGKRKSSPLAPPITA